MLSWMWIWALEAEARDVITWVEPDYPDRPTECLATLAVAPSGAVTVESVRGCRRAESVVRAALSEWAYAPAPRSTTEVVRLAHEQGAGDRLRSMTAVRWPTAELAASGRACFVRVSLEPDGAVSGVEVSGCPAENHEPLAQTVRERWRFASGVPESVWLTTSLPQNRPAPVTVVDPVFPGGAVADEARCEARLHVQPDGHPELVAVEGCEEPFLTMTTDTLSQWRWPRSDDPWAHQVAVSYRQE